MVTDSHMTPGQAYIHWYVDVENRRPRRAHTALPQQVLYRRARDSPPQNAFPRRNSRVVGYGTKRSVPATFARRGRGPRVSQLRNKHFVANIWLGCHAWDSRDIRCIYELCYALALPAATLFHKCCVPSTHFLGKTCRSFTVHQRYANINKTFKSSELQS